MSQNRYVNSEYAHATLQQINNVLKSLPNIFFSQVTTNQNILNSHLPCFLLLADVACRQCA